MTTGILLLNLGGPDSLAAVRPFLTQLFTDREIIRLPGGRVGQALLGRAIAGVRTPWVRRNYARIGGGSPIAHWTARQGEGLVERLRRRGHRVEWAAAMRYTAPSTEAALDRLDAAGVERIIALPLYPHYSRATTGSSLSALERAMALPGRRRLPLTVIETWHDAPPYLDALAARVREALAGFPTGATPTLLVSAHGLPEHFIAAGDPYCGHIQATIDGLLARLPPLPHVLGYQSRTGPVRWIGPTTHVVIDDLAARGVEDVLVLPISFVSDHIETLYEIDLLYAPHAARRGIRTFRRVEALNDFPPFLDALADIVEEKLA